MHLRFRVGIGACLLVSVIAAVQAGEKAPGVADSERARVNYMLNCQGCHGADGVGTVDGSVPEMKNFVGRFLSVPGGRAFLVQVPGSANAALTDARLAEVLNWMLWQVSAAQIPQDFEPYTAQEVGALRQKPLDDVEAIRASLVERMSLEAGSDPG